jgi:hypothetical protein
MRSAIAEKTEKYYADAAALHLPTGSHCNYEFSQQLLAAFESGFESNFQFFGLTRINTLDYLQTVQRPKNIQPSESETAISEAARSP